MKVKRRISQLKIIAAALTIFVFNVSSITGLSSGKPSGDQDLGWFQWRGPNRDGISLVKDIVGRWPKDDSKILWRISVGEGYSGMAVSKERLFSMWDEGVSQYLVCMDAGSGKEVWRYKIGKSYKDGWGNGPRSTPVFDDTRIFVTSAYGQLHAVRAADGKALWMHDLPAEYGGRIPDHGYSSSPLVDGDRLFVEVGGKEDYSFVAFDKNDGKIIWHRHTDEPSYSSPIVVSIGNTRQIVFLSAAGLFSVSPENGSLYWRYDWEARCPATRFPTNSSTPIFIAPDKIFISGGYGTVTGAAVIRLLKQREKFSVEEVWNGKSMKNVINSSVYYKDYIYGFDNNVLTCVEPLTGKVKWRARGFQRGSLIAADGHLIVLGERGKLALVKASPTEFVEISSTQVLNGICWTNPALANGKLYLRNQSEMICLDLSVE